jgi:hypothetical protein
MQVRLTRLHEFSLDLVPCSPLARIASRRLQSPVKLPLLSVCQLKCFVSSAIVSQISSTKRIRSGMLRFFACLLAPLPWPHYSVLAKHMR